MLFQGVFVTPTDYTEPHTSFLIVVETLIFGLVGLILGRLIDSFFTKLAKKYKKHKVLLSIIQIAVDGLVIAFLYMYISSFFANHFQRTLSGLAFPAFYFGTQTNIFNIWNQLL